MSYVPNTPAEQQAMLRAIGAESIEDLLATVPADVRLKRPLALPKALREADVRRLLMSLAEQNADLD
ncbi:MAG: glycine dehydrogenase, partial [Chloroflexota bacterium]|nr:glycine dehydrogenase [Chloroflexota bacterium]